MTLQIGQVLGSVLGSMLRFWIKRAFILGQNIFTHQLAATGSWMKRIVTMGHTRENGEFETAIK